MRKFVILAFLTAPAAPALAGTWTAPEGCEVFMTVQSKGCRVSHYYRCEADNPGDQWRVDLDQEGPFFYSKIDAEGQWVESYDPIRQTLDPSPADPARNMVSLTMVLALRLPRQRSTNTKPFKN